jgi:hypothetical protein
MTTHSDLKRSLVQEIIQTLKDSRYSVPGELWIYLILCDEYELKEIARKLDIQFS